MRAWQHFFFWIWWVYLTAYVVLLILFGVVRHGHADLPGWMIVVGLLWFVIQPPFGIAVIVDIMKRSHDRHFRTKWILLTLLLWPSTIIYYFRHGLKPRPALSPAGLTPAIPHLPSHDRSMTTTAAATAAVPPPIVHEAPGSKASLICGGVALTGLLCWFPFAAGIPAVILGHRARKAIKRSGGLLRGKDKATAGLALGYAALLMAVASAGCLIFVLTGVLRDAARNSTDQLAGEPGIISARSAEAAMSPFTVGSGVTGNTAEATRLASEISKAVRIFQKNDFTRSASSRDARENAPRVYCHLGSDRCAILIAPQMGALKWESDTEEYYEKGLWTITQAVIATADELPDPPSKMHLALGIWAGWQYHRLFFGPLAEEVTDGSVPPFESPTSALDLESKLRFYSYFAPEQPVKAEGDVRPQ
jgi:hypothetical protein